MSSYGGQVAFPGNSMYHATKWGIEGSTESVAQEFAPFGVGISIVEPGGARTEFRYGSAQVADALPDYAGTPARSFEKLFDPNAAQAPGGPARMATAIINTVDIQHASALVGSQSSMPDARTKFRDGGLDLRDPGQIEAPRLVHTDTVVGSHRTHCSAGIATSDHAITVLRSCSSIWSVAAGMSAGAPPTGWWCMNFP